MLDSISRNGVRPLEGRVAVVTGASRGIGAAIARRLADAGAAVALGARDRTALDRTGGELAAAGHTVHTSDLDISSGESVDAFVDSVLGAFGHVDILVNNAGVLTQGALLDGFDAWTTALDTNVMGTVRMTRAVGRHLVEQGSGKIVTVASNYAFKGVPGHSAYCASKAALVSLTKSLATEWARHNVQVNAIAPGFIETDLNATVRGDDAASEKILRTIPVRRFGTADDVAGIVLPLCDPSMTFLTGSVVAVDGGETAR